MIHSALIAASVATALLFGTAARAETREVRTSDLDLTTAAGQAKLDSRIDSAARALCRIDRTGSRIVGIDPECHAKAVASARESLAARRIANKSGG